MRIVSRLLATVVVLAVSVMVVLPVSAAPRDVSTLQQTPPCPTAVPNTHCVQPGEWLYCIGRAYQVTPWAIAQASGIPGPYAPQNPYPWYGNPYGGYYGGYYPYHHPGYYPYYAPWNFVFPGQRLTIPFNASSAWYNIPAGPVCAKQASVTPPAGWPPPPPTPVPYQPYPQPYPYQPYTQPYPGS